MSDLSECSVSPTWLGLSQNSHTTMCCPCFKAAEHSAPRPGFDTLGYKETRRGGSLVDTTLLILVKIHPLGVLVEKKKTEFQGKYDKTEPSHGFVVLIVKLGCSWSNLKATGSNFFKIFGSKDCLFCEISDFFQTKVPLYKKIYPFFPHFSSI